MNKNLQLQLLYKIDDSYINLLESHFHLSYRLELIAHEKLMRLSNSNLYLEQKRLNKRRLIIHGTDNPPDVWQLPTNSVFEVRNGVKFVSRLRSPNKLDNVVNHEHYMSYTLTLHMMTQHFLVNFNQNNTVIEWTWIFEEV